MTEIERMPASEESTQYLNRAGIFALQPVSVIQWKDKNGVPKADSNGHPGVFIVFKSEQGEMISKGYYYSKYSPGDPLNLDKSTKCKSEFMYTNLKVGLGFKASEMPTVKDFCSRKVWCIIKEVRLLNAQSKEYEESVYEIVGQKYFPYNSTLQTKGKPAIMGDPETTENHLPSGDFLEVREQYSGGSNYTPPPVSQAPLPEQSADQESSSEDLPSESGGMPDF